MPDSFDSVAITAEEITCQMYRYLHDLRSSVFGAHSLMGAKSDVTPVHQIKEKPQCWAEDTIDDRSAPSQTIYATRRLLLCPCAKHASGHILILSYPLI